MLKSGQFMANSPEIKFDLVFPEFEVAGEGYRNDVLKVRVPNEFNPPKKLVFAENSSFLTSAEREIVQQVIQGHTNRQIALKRNRSHNTVKNQLRNLGERIRGAGLEIHSTQGSGQLRINIILALLKIGELELQDPD